MQLGPNAACSFSFICLFPELGIWATSQLPHRLTNAGHLLQPWHGSHLWTGWTSSSFYMILSPAFNTLDFFTVLATGKPKNIMDLANLDKSLICTVSLKNDSAALLLFFSVVFSMLNFAGTALQRQQISMSYRQVSWENKPHNLHTQVLGHSSNHE